MTSDKQILEQALACLEESYSYVEEDAENAERMYGKYPTRQARIQGLKDEARKHWDAITALREALAEQPAQQQKEGFASPGGGYVPAIPRPMPLDWKLVPRKATPEMLKAMDECAQEGYDERLYAGMASSVYMAAWDASPVMGTLPEQPAQQQEPVAWVVEDQNGERLEWAEVAHIGWGWKKLPLYTSPPAQRTFVGLTDEEIDLLEDLYAPPVHPDFVNDADHCTELIRHVEAKLKEKNA